MSAESIVILGGSFAGIGAAHYALRHVIPKLPKKQGVSYNVIMVNPSTDMYWRIAAPRAAVSKEMMPPSKTFYPIAPAFSYAASQFKLVQGSATHIDPAGQTVSVTTPTGEQQTIPYAALVVATGFTSPSPLFTQKTDAKALQSVYGEFQSSLKGAKRIVIGGGGPVGVETAGEVSEILNGKPGWFAPSFPKDPKANITLISGDKKLLPILRASLGQTAETYLNRLGCEVTYNTRVVSTSKTGSKTLVELSNGETINADIYIDATGTRPNTSFLPKEWLNSRNRLACNEKTLRVEHATAGPRIYALGDAASYTRGGVMDMADAIPVAMCNLRTDLIAHLTGKAPTGDRHYTANLKESQVVPIGTQKGVGAFGGNKLPSQMVWMMKGRDYMIGMLAEATLKGDGFKKEGKWTPVRDATAKVGFSSG
ncbi:FAD/NAD(P)-binding domain-containing protein [Plenodomus tracheiphilus IPT5]|uniref:FAD/NAD(P)-binding domain-containing protein n=1 Tax=Plenodomus tracheiphilus IPT5 TaxID=1408161 RepID=A0A6A7B080_9PLEO|nr:FAD/NAD(P)-binding domain-containing protein [Plenodomus tracheiphilus IPT5]